MRGSRRTFASAKEWLTILVHITSPEATSLTRRPSAELFDAMGRDLPQQATQSVTLPQHEQYQLPGE